MDGARERIAKILETVGLWALPLGPLYLECVFSALTASSLPSAPAIAFSLVAGGLAAFIRAFISSPRARRIASAAFLVIFGAAFAAEYFIWHAFGVFYDLKTSFGGLADMAGSFAGETAALVLSPAGIAAILVFMLPALISIFRYTGEAGHPWETRGASDVWRIAAGHALALALIAMSGSWASYTDSYSFQTAVPNFGLITGARLDIADILVPHEAGFSAVQAEPEPAPEPEPELEPAEEEPAEPEVPLSAGGYELGLPVVLDIDFEALAESAPSGSLAETDRYVASLTPSTTNEMTGRFEGYNLILISAEAFTAEAIREDTTPTLWRMATRGIQFTDYYQFDTAGTTGGECSNIFGVLATEGGSSVKMTSDNNNWLTMGNLLNRQGYEGWAFHNNTYTYYGRDQTHVNLGYSNGYMGYGNGMEEWVEWVWPESDLQMVQGTYENLYGMHGAEGDPFNVYYMSVSGHSNYDPGENRMASKYTELVDDLEYSSRVKGYLAANIELDRAMEWLIGQLEADGIAERTVIAISADHYPYGLDSGGGYGSGSYLAELYGYPVENIFQHDHNRLIIWSTSLENEEPIVVDSPASSIDLLPTLANLFACEWDSRLLPGRDVFSDAPALVFDLSYDWKTDLGTYYAGAGRFEPVEGAEIPEGYVEQTSQAVRDKIYYCREVLRDDYWGHVFGEPDDVVAVNEAAQAARAQ